MAQKNYTPLTSPDKQKKVNSVFLIVVTVTALIVAVILFLLIQQNATQSPTVVP